MWGNPSFDHSLITHQAKQSPGTQSVLLAPASRVLWVSLGCRPPQVPISGNCVRFFRAVDISGSLTKSHVPCFSSSSGSLATLAWLRRGRKPNRPWAQGTLLAALWLVHHPLPSAGRGRPSVAVVLTGPTHVLPVLKAKRRWALRSGRQGRPSLCRERRGKQLFTLSSPGGWPVEQSEGQTWHPLSACDGVGQSPCTGPQQWAGTGWGGPAGFSNPARRTDSRPTPSDCSELKPLRKGSVSFELSLSQTSNCVQYKFSGRSN